MRSQCLEPYWHSLVLMAQQACARGREPGLPQCLRRPEADVVKADAIRSFGHRAVQSSSGKSGRRYFTRAPTEQPVPFRFSDLDRQIQLAQESLIARVVGKIAHRRV